MPEKMSILKVVPEGVTEEKASEVASVFGVGGEVRTVGDAVMVSEGSREVRLYRYGGFRYIDEHQMTQRPIPPEEFLPDSQCIEIADRFLENLRDQGLVSKSLGFSFVDVVADSIVYSANDNTVATYWTNKHVNYVLSYGGVPLHGGMAKVRVYLNERGQIVGFFGDFWEVEPYRRTRVLSPKEAISRWLEPDVRKATVEEIELVYSVPSSEATYIEPSYTILATFEMSDGRTVRAANVIPAIEK